MRILLLLTLCLSTMCSAQLTLNGQWDLILSSTDITEAGLDYPNQFQSSTNQTELTWSSSLFNPLLTCVVNINNYRVNLRKININWDPALTMSIRRTGDGTPDALITNPTTLALLNSSVSNGTIYQEIQDTDIEIVRFRGCRNDIPFQFKLEGMSVTLPVETYSITLMYTIYDDGL